MPRFAVILPAAGKSSRFRNSQENEGGAKKPFALLAGRAVWLHAAERFASRADVVQILMVINPADREYAVANFGEDAARLKIEFVDGGAERYDSVVRALAVVRSDVDFVAVHDAARPCITSALIDAVFSAAVETGAAILATPVTGTLKRGSGQIIAETVPRDDLWEAQTPQVFRRELLAEAYCRREERAATDDSQLVEWIGGKITIVPGSAMNIKITRQEDVRVAGEFLKG